MMLPVNCNRTMTFRRIELGLIVHNTDRYFRNQRILRSGIQISISGRSRQLRIRIKIIPVVRVTKVSPAILVYIQPHHRSVRLHLIGVRIIFHLLKASVTENIVINPAMLCDQHEWRSVIP